ncbi:MAG: glycosyltransferase family 2 protein [Alphaproteobacteria bacterium]|nr:glycosyltransferase family 2 protein [Alphaproteobacteria bacterium]
MTKVSIIVPCYNVEQFVTKCLTTLVNQTLQDIEIICIDDKSTDGTLKILQEFASKDNRIKLFKLQKNSGVATARNTGLKNATGEYIGFVDPDDYVDLDFYEKLYNKAVETSSDIVKGNVIVINAKNKNIKPYYSKRHKQELYNFSSTFWSAIYRHDMINKHNIHFPETALVAEDSVFLTQATLCANEIHVVPNIKYCYLFRRDNSLDSGCLNHGKAMSNLKAFKLNLQYILSANLNNNMFKKYLYHHVIDHALYEISKRYENIEDQQLMFEFLSSVRNDYGIKKFFDSVIPRTYRKAFKYNNFDKYFSMFSSTRKRLYLFGVMPLIKIEVYNDSRLYLLFDFLPLMKIKNNKMYLFSFLLFLKLRS